MDATTAMTADEREAAEREERRQQVEALYAGLIAELAKLGLAFEMKYGDYAGRACWLTGGAEGVDTFDFRVEAELSRGHGGYGLRTTGKFRVAYYGAAGRVSRQVARELGKTAAGIADDLRAIAANRRRDAAKKQTQAERDAARRRVLEATGIGTGHGSRFDLLPGGDYASGMELRIGRLTEEQARKLIEASVEILGSN
jgi:hypothetical protein